MYTSKPEEDFFRAKVLREVSLRSSMFHVQFEETCRIRWFMMFSSFHALKLVMEISCKRFPGTFDVQRPNKEAFVFFAFVISCF